MRERGSKPFSLLPYRLSVDQHFVAPHAGAWIETLCRRAGWARARACRSMRERGSARPRRKIAVSYHPRSLPVRERGSKRLRHGQCHFVGSHGRSPCGSVDRNCKTHIGDRTDAEVAPHAGAWIETSGRGGGFGVRSRVAPRAGAWIETTASRSAVRRRSPCRSPCGSVDRNTLALLVSHAVVGVAPHAGAWIETCSRR